MAKLNTPVALGLETRTRVSFVTDTNQGGGILRTAREGIKASRLPWAEHPQQWGKRTAALQVFFLNRYRVNTV